MSRYSCSIVIDFCSHGCVETLTLCRHQAGHRWWPLAVGPTPERYSFALPPGPASPASPASPAAGSKFIHGGVPCPSVWQRSALFYQHHSILNRSWIGSASRMTDGDTSTSLFYRRHVAVILPASACACLLRVFVGGDACAVLTSLVSNTHMYGILECLSWSPSGLELCFRPCFF